VIHPLDQFAAAADDATERIGVTAEVLGSRMQGDIGAELERVLIDRRGEGVVDGQGRGGYTRGRYACVN